MCRLFSSRSPLTPSVKLGSKANFAASCRRARPVGAPLALGTLQTHARFRDFKIGDLARGATDFYQLEPFGINPADLFRQRDELARLHRKIPGLRGGRVERRILKFIFQIAASQKVAERQSEISLPRSGWLVTPKPIIRPERTPDTRVPLGHLYLFGTTNPAQRAGLISGVALRQTSAFPPGSKRFSSIIASLARAGVPSGP